MNKIPSQRTPTILDASEFQEALGSLSQVIVDASAADPAKDSTDLLSKILKILLNFSGAAEGRVSLFSEVEDLFIPAAALRRISTEIFAPIPIPTSDFTSGNKGSSGSGEGPFDSREGPFGSIEGPFHTGEGPAGRAVQEHKALYLGPGSVVLDRLASSGSLVERVCLPMIVFGQTKGLLDLLWSPAQELPAEKGWQIEALASQAAGLFSASQSSAQVKATTGQLIIYYVFGSRILGAKTLPQALDLIVRFALEITPAQSVILYLWDTEEKLPLGHGLDRSGSLIREKAQLYGEDISRHILNSRQPVVISGLERNASKRIPAFLNRLGIASYISLPLKFSNPSLQGVLDLHYQERRSFTSMELEGMRLFADQASNSIDHLHLLDHNRQRQTDLDAIIDTIHILTSTLDIDDLLQQISIRLTWVMDVDACSIAAYEPFSNRMNVLAHYNSLGAIEGTFETDSYDLHDYPATANLLETGDYLVVDTNDPRANPAETSYLHRFGYKTSLVYPLIAIDQPIGVVELYSRRSEHRFAMPVFRKMRLLSEQIALALINARIYGQEQRVRLMAENLKDAITALNSTLELNQVLDLILMHLQKVVRLDNASVLLIEGDTFHIAADHNQVNLKREKITKHISEEPLVAAILQQKGPLILADAQQDERFTKTVEAEQVRGWMGVPMMERGEVIGMLTVESRSPHRYTEEDARLALSFANQAAIAVINARLYQSARRQRMLADSMRGLSLELSGSLKSKDILDVLLDRLRSIVPYDTGCVMLVDGSTAKIGCQRGFERYGQQEEAAKFQLPLIAIPYLLQLANTNQPLLISDVQADPNWFPTKISAHVRSWIGAPLMARERLLGFLCLDKVEAGFYKSEHIKNLEILATHASLALLNAQTYGEVELASITDFLTGTYNHRHFHQQLRQELERALRLKYPLSLLMIDLDFFKRVNDTHGHPTGDEVLRLLAQRLKKELRAVDMLARYGGEEFAVILPGARKSDLAPVAERLLTAISNAPFQVENLSISLTISIGGAEYPEDAADAQNLVLQADHALYVSKHSGRNSFHVVGM